MKAACQDLPVRWFYEDAWSDLRQEPWAEGEDRARRICCSCPIQEDCLTLALERREEFGIWGGTNPKDRRKFLRKRLDIPSAMWYFGFRQPEPPEATTSDQASVKEESGRCPTK